MHTRNRVKYIKVSFMIAKVYTCMVAYISDIANCIVMHVTSCTYIMLVIDLMCYCVAIVHPPQNSQATNSQVISII